MGTLPELSTMLSSGSGSYDPGIFILAMLFAAIVVILIWQRGYSGYKRRSEQTKVFLCGHDEPSKEALHIPAGSLYWGFLTALEGYFNWLKKEHTGMPNDYTSWFVLTTGIVAFVILAWGV